MSLDFIPPALGEMKRSWSIYPTPQERALSPNKHWAWGGGREKSQHPKLPPFPGEWAHTAVRIVWFLALWVLSDYMLMSRAKGSMPTEQSKGQTLRIHLHYAAQSSARLGEARYIHEEWGLG